MDNSEVNAEIVLYKSQFKIKLPLKYLVVSSFSLILILLLLMFSPNWLIGLTIYSFLMLIYYKWFFPFTREGYQYTVFGYSIIGKLMNKIQKHYIKNNNEK